MNLPTLKIPGSFDERDSPSSCFSLILHLIALSALLFYTQKHVSRATMSSAPPPSSFDENVEFYEESRWQKLRRKIVEEPLIPLGCALTCWALFEATKSIKTGDKHRTNRMFRRRIYAQGFTIAAMLAGSVYWESDRSKRKQYNELLDEKKRKEKHENWIKELEIRDQEEEELRRERQKILQNAAAKNLASSQSKPSDGTSIRSVLDQFETRRPHIARSALEAMGGRWT